jgi:hypothetical protein
LPLWLWLAAGGGLHLSSACAGPAGEGAPIATVSSPLQDPDVEDYDQYSWDPGLGGIDHGGPTVIVEPTLGTGEGDQCFECEFDEDCTGTRDAALDELAEACTSQCGVNLTQPEDVGSYQGEACFRFRCCGGGANNQDDADCQESYQQWFYGLIGPDCGPVDDDDSDDDEPHDCGDPCRSIPTRRTEA